MNTFRSSWSTCWGHLSDRWGVSRGDWRPVLVYAFNRYGIWGADKLLVWRESDGAIWIDGVNTDIWHCLSALTIFEGHWAIQVDWHRWVTWGKDWAT